VSDHKNIFIFQITICLVLLVEIGEQSSLVKPDNIYPLYYIFQHMGLPEDIRYAAELERKMRVFREQTKIKKALFLTLITTYGLKKNQYADSLVHNDLTIDSLFD